MAMTDFTIITRSMTSRRFSTITTVLTVAVAVAIMLMLLSMRHAGQRAFERGAGNMHMLVSADDNPLVAVLNSVFYSGVPRQPLTWQKYTELVQQFPVWEYAIPTQLGDSHRGFPVMATTRDFFERFEPNLGQPWQVAEGRFFTDSFEVVVGAEVARQTGIRIGDEFDITHGIDRSRGIFAGSRDPGQIEPHIHYGFPYRVVGILAPTGSAHDRAMFTDLTSSWIIHAHDRRRAGNPNVSRTTKDDLIDEDRLITGVYLRVATRPGRQLSGAQQQVYDMLRRDTTITVADPHHEIRRLFSIIGNIDQIFLAMAGLVMVSSAIAIMLALYNSMEQRRRQIAIMRVLGCSRWRIFGFVLTESATLGLLGAIVGIALSYLGMLIVVEIMHQRLGLLIEPSLEPVWTFVLVMATILLAAAAGLVPAAAAYRTPVVHNLRPLG